MKSLFRLLTIVIFGIASCFDLIAQTEYPTPIEFIFNQTTLNRAVVQQFNKPENPKTINTVINGIPVTFSYVNRPVVEISDALYLRVFFSLTDQLETGLIVENYQVKVPFAIEAIEWNTATNDGIDDGAYLTLNQNALVSSINNLPISAERKSLLISVLDRPELKRYQILSQSFNEVHLWRLSDFNDFKIKTIPTISALVDGSFKVVINPTYVAKRPSYKVSLEVVKKDNETPAHYHMIVKIESNVKFKLNTISVRIDGLIMDWPRIINKTATVNSSGSYECSANFNTFNSSNNQPSIIYLTGNYRIQHVYLNITRDTYISNVEWVKPTPCAPIYVSCEQLTELQYLNGVYRTFDEN